MRKVCIQLGGFISVPLKTDLNSFPRIGNNDCKKGHWLGAIQGPKLANGSHLWLDDRFGKEPQSPTKITWDLSEPNGGGREPCVLLYAKEGFYAAEDDRCDKLRLDIMLNLMISLRS